MKSWFCTTLDSTQFLPGLGKVLSLNHPTLTLINVYSLQISSYQVYVCVHVSCVMCKYSYGWMYVYALWDVEARTKDQVFLGILNLLGFFCFVLFFR